MWDHLPLYHRSSELLPQRIVVVRSLPGLGDMLCIVPALRALRAAFPDACITLIGLPWSTILVQRFNCYLNNWLSFPGYPGIPEVPLAPLRVLQFLTDAQQLQFDLALQLHGNGSYINSFTLLLGAKHSAGFFPAGYPCPAPHFFLPYPDHLPEVWRPLQLLEYLGIPLQGDDLEFPLGQVDWDEFDAIARNANLQQGNYLCIHPGASASDRRWTACGFAIVADRLAALGWQIVLTGTAAERELVQAVAAAMTFPAVVLAGQTSLGAIAALLKRARLLICNDTGVSHLAVAVQTRSVVIFSNSEVNRWAPCDRQQHRIVIARQLEADVAAVIAEAVELLDRQSARQFQQEMVYAS